MDQDKQIEGDYYNNQSAADLNEKGIELSQSGDLSEGKEVFLEALKLEPNNPTTLSNLGLNRFLDYDYDNAIKYYQKSYTISDSTYHIAAVNLGLTYYYTEKFDQGIVITNYVIKHATDSNILSSAYVHRALNYLGQEKCDKAQTDLDYITDNFLGEANIDYHIVDLTEKINDCIRQKL